MNRRSCALSNGPGAESASNGQGSGPSERIITGDRLNEYNQLLMP